MAKRLCCSTLLAILPLALLCGCGEMGKVEQGRVIAFDKAKETVTFIVDAKHDSANPDYSGAAVTFSLPQDPNERGADPKAGKRMKLDTKAKEITIYYVADKSFKKISYTLIDENAGVDKDNPLVAGKKFPLVDRAKKTITIYSGKQKAYVVFSLPDEYFDLPDDTWEAGDEVRVYYKEPGKALRFQNITKTDIFKK